MITVNAYIYAALFVTMAVLTCLALYQRFKNSRELMHLTASLSWAAIGYFLLWFFYANQLSGLYIESGIILSFVALNWANYFIYLHYTSLVSLNPTSGGRHQLVISVIIAATIIKFFKLIGYLESIPINLFYCASALIGVMTFTLALQVVIVKQRTIKNKAAVLDVMAVSLILFGAISYAYGGISSVIVGESDIQNLVSFIGGFFNLCGIFCILLNYMIFNYAYHPMKPVDGIFLYSETGNSLYSYVSPALLSFNDSIQELIRKLFTTIDTLAKHLINPRSKVELVQTRNYRILFAQTTANITFCVISSEMTYFLKKSIERFLKMLLLDHTTTLQEPREVPYITRINNMIEKTFCYFINHSATNQNSGEIRCVIK